MFSLPRNRMRADDMLIIRSFILRFMAFEHVLNTVYKILKMKDIIETLRLVPAAVSRCQAEQIMQKLYALSCSQVLHWCTSCKFLSLSFIFGSVVKLLASSPVRNFVHMARRSSETETCTCLFARRWTYMSFTDQDSFAGRSWNRFYSITVLF